MTSSFPISPPTVLGLRWEPAFDPLVLRSPLPRSGFFNAAVDRVPFPAGLSREDVRHAHDPDQPSSTSLSTSIAFRAHLAAAGEIEAWAIAIVTAEADIAMAHLAWHRQMRQTTFDKEGPAFARYIASVKAEAVAALDEWGLAFKDAEKLRKILDVEIPLHGELKAMKSLLAANKRKQEMKRKTVAASTQRGVECDDETVVRAIVALTGLDDDRAELPNDEGWGGSTSPGGHWCHAMLSVDRSLAIKEGRRLIASGKHQAQLARLGIDVGGAA